MHRGKIYRLLCVSLLFLLSVIQLYGREPKCAKICGRIIDKKSGEPLYLVNIVLDKTPFGDATDVDGYYAIEDMPPGNYILKVKMLGYKEVAEGIVVSSGERVIRNFKLEPTMITIGGITVIAERDLIPDEHTTTTRISSGEIQHMQASSLGDVLGLVPGVEKTARQGLSGSIRAAIRGSSADALSTFGTKIIVDGVSISNNTDMQWTSFCQGIDLRGIPADDIQEVEVVKGVPSVRYGDLTSGIMNVIIKARREPLRIRAKYNPDTREANLSSGFNLFGTNLSYNLNYAFSERDLRETGDGFHRISGRFTVSDEFIEDRLSVRFKSFLRRMIDDDAPSTDYRLQDYDRSYSVYEDINTEYRVSPILKIKTTIYLHYDHNDRHKERWVLANPSYIGKLTILGDEVNAGTRLESRYIISEGTRYHTVTMGGELIYEGNFGNGYTDVSYYDPEQGKEPYSFDGIPNRTIGSLYLEDKTNSSLFDRDYSFTFGVRGDLFGNAGNYISPRAGLLFSIFSDRQIRISAGNSAKLPSMSHIWVPPKWGEDQSNPYLKAYRMEKYEVSYDRKFGKAIGVSFTGYQSYSWDRPSGVGYPLGYKENPDTISATTYTVYDNRGWLRNRGIELTLKTARIHNFAFDIGGSYRFGESGRRGLVYDSSPDTAAGETVWYKPGTSWNEKGLIDFKVEYTAKPLKLWVSFETQGRIIHNRKYNHPRPPDEDYNKLARYPVKWLSNVRVSKSLFPGADISLYINNFPDDRALFRVPNEDFYSEGNLAVFYGLDFSMPIGGTR